MKTSEKIIGIKEHLNERMVRKNLWYFSEEIVKGFSHIQQEEYSKKVDSEKRVIKGKDEPLIHSKTLGGNRIIRECSFVVDWQLSDK